ncbi:MAG: hypothetical protein KIS87_00115 [Phycisphaeraceae bacterium]|nr:hypothetical protein [Phycisphaeraceae bacterium]
MHRLATLLVLAACSAALAQQYQAYVTPALSQYGIPESYPRDLNVHSLAVGFMTYTTEDAGGNDHTTYHGFSWAPEGGPRVHPTPSSSTGINDEGDILAHSTFYYFDNCVGKMHPIPGDLAVNEAAINNVGVVTGTLTYRSYGDCTYARRAIAWTLAGGRANREFVVPAAAVGRDVNGANEVVGVATSSGSCGDFEALLYRADNDQWIDLHAMLTGGGYGITEAVAVNNLGQVVGEGWNGSFGVAWLWDEFEGFTFRSALKSGDRDRVTPFDVNNVGTVIGTAATGIGVRSGDRPSPSPSSPQPSLAPPTSTATVRSTLRTCWRF